MIRPFATTGLMVAGQPWSGNYSVGKETWVTAQVTQFVQPGWQFLDGAGDAGDGNAWDHGDWAGPESTCTG